MVLFDGVKLWKRGMCLVQDILPKAPVKTPRIKVHISYFLQKCKKGKAKLPKDFDITNSEPIYKKKDT